jgi:hypothetical protein
MYLVDTSVWIHALRPEGDSSIRSRLKPLIVSGETAVTEWIILELMTGLLSPERKDTLLRWFAPIARLAFQTSWWEDTWEYAARLRKRGLSPTAADCFIATVAIQHQVGLVHCDADFEAMRPTIPLKTLDWTPHLSRR